MSGLSTTFALLGQTPNEAAARLLVEALDGPTLAVRVAAIRAILERRSEMGIRKLADRVDQLTDEEVSVVTELHGRAAGVLRDMVQSNDAAQVEVGCRAAIRFHEYELMPTLIWMLEEAGHHFADQAAAALTELADQLVHELASLRDERRRRDPTIARRNVTTALEQSVSRYPQHQRREPLEAFLQLANRDNAALHRLLTDSRDPCYAPLCEVLLNSDRPGVVRLLLHFLDDPRPPVAGLQALFKRTDQRMRDKLLKRIGSDPSSAVRANLRRVDAIAWAADELLPTELDDEAQQAAVTAIVASGMKRAEVFQTLVRFAKHGRPGGRRAAIAALPEFNGPEADVLLLQALNDDEPEVRAAALVQLRPRGIPGALSTLLDALDSTHSLVREAARTQLQEFTFRRFLPAFDMLADDVRRTTGKLVAKVDPTSASQLREELHSSLARRRARAIEAADAMELTEALEETIVECTQDADHLVRAEAARALAGSHSETTREALKKLLTDANFSVSEAAQFALDQPARAIDAMVEATHGRR